MTGGDAGAVRFRAPRWGLDDRVMGRLKEELASCPDVAFAHLVEAVPPGQAPALALFVWIEPQAMGSIRSALNLVCRTVGQVLPDDRFTDVVILNSAPELLADVEAAGCLLVEPDPEEHARALESLRALQEQGPEESTARGWWPFGR
ncbi:MAG TPA: hypothetical protein ENK19_03495 [Acidobacteria bacterium]|nr:hypothetical protein [Acidobacteriota bacterium]